MARPVLNQEAADVVVKAAPKETPARDAVFSTYELLELIFNALPLQYVLQSATKVNKAWHEVVATSIPISKRIISSPRLLTLLKTRKVKNPDILYRSFFWGSLIIKKDIGHNDVVYAIDGSTTRPFPSQFVTDLEAIPFLTAADRKRFEHGWWRALTTWRSTPGGEDFLTRFELGLYKYLDPVYGAKAEQLYRFCNKWDGGRHRRQKRLPTGLVEFWSDRDRVGQAAFEEDVDRVIKRGSS